MEKSTYPGAIWIHRFGGREAGERERGLKPGWVHQLHASPPGRHRLLTVRITPWRRWQHPGSFYISRLRGKQQSSGFSKPGLSWNIVLWLREAINQLSENFALVPPLALQHWWCRAALNIPHLLIFLGTARIQSTELNYLASMICNSHLLWWLMLKLKYFHVAAWISSAVGKDFLCWDMPANYISIWHQRWFAQIYSILGLFHLQFGGELTLLVLYKLGLCLLVQSRNI